jgi:hypothetical protein
LAVQLAADAANQKIIKWGQDSQYDCRARLSLAIRLWQLDENYVPLVRFFGGVSRSATWE